MMYMCSCSVKKNVHYQERYLADCMGFWEIVQFFWCHNNGFTEFSIVLRKIWITIFPQEVDYDTMISTFNFYMDFDESKSVMWLLLGLLHEGKWYLIYDI